MSAKGYLHKCVQTRCAVQSNGTMRMRSMDPPLFLETINNAVKKNNFKHVCAAVVCFICLGSFEIRRVGNTLRDKYYFTKGDDTLS